MPRDHDYCVYIVTNYTNTVLYIGITSDLEGRLWEHAHGEAGSKFTRKYHVNRLLYYEQFGDVHAAIAREKQLKGWTRAKKEALIRTLNPTYADLGVLLGFRGVCRQPEGPSAPLHSAQDDRAFGSASPGDDGAFGSASPGDDRAFGSASSGGDRAFGSASSGGDRAFGSASPGDDGAFGSASSGGDGDREGNGYV